MLTTNIHNVISIKLSDVRKLSVSDCYVRDVTITDAKGMKYVLTLFADIGHKLRLAADFNDTNGPCENVIVEWKRS